MTPASRQRASARRLGKPCLCSTAPTLAAPPWDPCNTPCQYSALWPVQLTLKTAFADSVHLRSMQHQTSQHTNVCMHACMLECVLLRACSAQVCLKKVKRTVTRTGCQLAVDEGTRCSGYHRHHDCIAKLNLLQAINRCMNIAYSLNWGARCDNQPPCQATVFLPI